MDKNDQKWTKMDKKGQKIEKKYQTCSATANKNQAHQVFECVGHCKYFKVRVNSKYIIDCS